MSRVVAIQNNIKYDKKVIDENYDKLMAEFNGLKNIVNAGEKVLVKPNLVAPSQKATTDLYLLEKMLSTLLELGAHPIVAESSGFEFSTKETFKILKVDKLCEKLNVELINLDDEEFIEVSSGNPYVPIYLLPNLVFQVDRIINMPRLKGHALTMVTFSIKNLFGLLHRETRRKIHATNLELGISYLKKLIPVDFVLVDGLWRLVSAVYSDSEYQGILVGGTDVTAVDIYCCRIWSVNYKEIPHICIGEIPSLEICELSKIDQNKILGKNKSYKIKNCQYKLMYIVDLLVSKWCNSSIIPYIHYYGGIHCSINMKKCMGCGMCEKICPMKAIKDKKIDIRKCINVRCLQCFDTCPQNAIEKKGLHK